MEVEITILKKSRLICPQCGFQQEEEMPTDACLWMPEARVILSIALKVTDRSNQ
jgi:hypothetical protein